MREYTSPERAETYTYDDLLAAAKAAAEYWGREDYIQGSNDWAQGVRPYRQPGTDNSLRVCFDAQRERDHPDGTVEDIFYQVDAVFVDPVAVEDVPVPVINEARRIMENDDEEAAALICHRIEKIRSRFGTDRTIDPYFEAISHYCISGLDLIGTDGKVEYYNPDVTLYNPDDEEEEATTPDADPFDVLTRDLQEDFEAANYAKIKKLLDIVMHKTDIRFGVDSIL